MCLLFVFVQHSSESSPNEVSLVSKVLLAIGKETFIIMAFSQIIIVSLNLHTGWGSVFRYVCLAVAIFILVCMKNLVNHVLGEKVL